MGTRLIGDQHCFPGCLGCYSVRSQAPGYHIGALLQGAGAVSYWLFMLENIRQLPTTTNSTRTGSNRLEEWKLDGREQNGAHELLRVIRHCPPLFPSSCSRPLGEALLSGCLGEVLWYVPGR